MVRSAACHRRLLLSLVMVGSVFRIPSRVNSDTSVGGVPDGVEVGCDTCTIKWKKGVAAKIGSKALELRAQLHTPGKHDSTPEPPKEAGRNIEHQCHIAGFCVHGAAGRATTQMRSQLNKAICSTKFPTKQSRSILSKSGVVICVTAATPSAPLAAGVFGPIAPPLIINSWVHLGDVSLSPHGFKGQELELVGDSKPISSTSACGEVQLAGMWVFKNEWELCRGLSKAFVVVCSLFWFLFFL